MEFPSSLGQWEWAIGEFIILPFLVWELIKTRRLIREDREAKQKAEPPPPDGNAP